MDPEQEPQVYESVLLCIAELFTPETGQVATACQMHLRQAAELLTCKVGLFPLEKLISVGTPRAYQIKRFYNWEACSQLKETCCLCFTLCILAVARTESPSANIWL